MLQHRFARWAVPGSPRAVVCLVAGLLAAAPGHAASPIQHLGREQGLPIAQVHAIEQDANGLVWFAGPLGLTRYDGARMIVKGPADGLTTQGLRSLARGRDGSLWIGHDAGVDVMDASGSFRPLADPESWSFGFVDDIAADPRGGMWLATPGGLVEWSPQGGMRHEDRLPPVLATVERAADGTIWAAGATLGLRYLAADGWRLPEGDDWQRIAPVVALAAGSDGSLLAGGAGGLVELDARGRLLGRIGDPARVSAIASLDEELWVGAAGELRLYRRGGDRWRLAEVVLDSVQVNDIFTDRQDNVWVATESSGVVKVSVLRRAVGRVSPPCKTQIYSIFRAADDGLLIGGDQCSWRLDGELEVGERFAELDRIKVWDLLEDAVGGVWAATESGLLHRPAGEAMRQVGADSPVLAAPGRCLLERRGELWVGTVAGLVTVSPDGAVTDVPDPEGRPLGYVYTLEEDSSGRLWAGTIGRGLWRGSERGRLRQLTAPGITARGNVYSVAPVAAGKTAVVQDDRIVVLDGEDSWRLPSATGDSVAGWSALSTGAGELWVGGSSGLVQYDLETRRARRHLSAATGLAGDEFTTSRSLIEDRRGRLLCGLAEGLSIVDREALAAIREPPQARLSEIVWHHAAVVSRRGATVVEYGRWTLDLHLHSPWFVDERSLLLRYRLRGFADRWSADQPLSQPIHFTGLPPGSYALEAQVSSPLMGPGPAAELVSFRVAAPWWRRGYVLPIWLALAAAGVLGAWRWRSGFLIQRARALEAQVVERTAELHLANLELERRASHSEERYRLLYAAVKDAIIIFDAQSQRIVDANDAAVDRYGYSADELRRLRAPAFSADPKTADAHIRQLSVAGGGKLFLSAHRKKDGTVFPVEVSAGVFTLGGRPMIYGVFRDVTQRQQAEELRERLITELEVKNAQLERFTYTVSHDLKSPLVTIRGYLGYLERDAAAGNLDRLARDAARIRAATGTMARLLDGLLELSRIGRVMGSIEEVSLGDLARKAVELLSGQLAEGGADVDVAPGMPTVLGDRIQLLQVLQNLLENAVKFMGDQPRPRIEIGAREEDGDTVCWVRDNGIGIDPRYHEKVFELFDRLDLDRKGTGIGLALVKRIVEVHGGRAWVESEGLGLGSAFFFTLPTNRF